MDNKVCIISCREYSVYLEPGKADEAWLHCDVRAWSKEIYIRLLAHLTDILKEFDNEIYVYVEQDNSKLVKFIEMFGFRHLKKAEGLGDVYGHWV